MLINYTVGQMGINVKITDNSGEYLKALEEVKERALEAVGIQAEGHAKVELSNSPERIDTGLLRNSITHAVSGKSAIKKTRSPNRDCVFRNDEGRHF